MRESSSSNNNNNNSTTMTITPKVAYIKEHQAGGSLICQADGVVRRPISAPAVDFDESKAGHENDRTPVSVPATCNKSVNSRVDNTLVSSPIIDVTAATSNKFF
jgi:hypothetical protein